MDPTTARPYLARVRRRAAELDNAKAARNAAIIDAMNAGVRRADIAKAAGLSIPRVKQIRAEGSLTSHTPNG